MVDEPERAPRDGGQADRLCIALVTRRRRPLFVEAGVRERVKAAVRAAGEAAGCRVACCEVWPAEVRVQVEPPPGVEADELVARLREAVVGALAKAGRQEGGVLARRAVVTTVPVAETDCGSAR